MTEQTETQPDAVTKVARDLSAIEDLACHLEGQAIHKANAMIDGTGLPGGLAMVTLGPDAQPDEWAEQVAAAELRHFTICDKANHKDCTVSGAEHVDDQDDEWEPVLQTLLFWSEAWRHERDANYGQTPTIASEANFIRYTLSWAWDNEPHFEDMARDINRARGRLENVLYAGRRVERTGVSCINLECERKPRLIKVYGHRAVDDRYKCPACKRKYDHHDYARAKAEHFDSKGAARYVKMQDARDAIDRSERTFRKWLRFWYVRSYRDPLTGQVWCWWPDVRETDLDTPKRNRQQIA